MAILCSLALLAAWYVATHTQLIDKWQGRSTVVELRELPFGPLKIRGVVTYLDYANKRFWLQDQTGAIAIDLDPASLGVKFGETVLVSMRKTHAYDPTVGLSSMALTDFKVEKSRSNALLPSSVSTTIATLSEEAKNGIRIETEGVVHGAAAKGSGIVEVDLGDEGDEVQAFVPGDPRDLATWLNARVRVTGVLEVLLDKGGSPTSEVIWVQNAGDLVKISNAPPAPATVTIRKLFAASNNLTANLVRIRGKALSQEAPNQLLLEDGWGTVGCSLERPGNFAPGTAVEVEGFAIRDGLRVDLNHVVVTPIAADTVPESPQNAPATTIASLRSQSESLLRTMPPVKVTGIVTYVNTDYRQLFLQDATAGIFVKYAGAPFPLYQGEKIVVTGLAKPGDFAPVIVAPKFVSLGPAALPTPRPLNMAAEYGVLDSLYGEAVGVVHPLRGKVAATQQTTFDMYTSFGVVHVGVMELPSQNKLLAGLQDATARVRGVAGEVFNSRKQMVALQLAVQNMKGIEIVEPGSPDPFSKPATPIGSLLRFSPGARPDHRVVVSGAVTMLGRDFFYVQDKTGGVRIESGTDDLEVGDQVEAAGYATATGYSPVLTDAVVKILRGTSAIPPQPVTADSLSEGSFDSQLVSIDATLLSTESSAGARTLSVISGGHAFQAVLYTKDTGQPFTPPQEGSLVRLTGICSVQVEHGKSDNLLRKEAVEFRLMIPSPSDVQVLKGGSWWTLRHSLIVVGALVFAVFVSLGRIVVLIGQIEGKDEELQRASEKESAIRQLIDAMQQVREDKQFTSRVSLPKADELAQLGAEFNHMIEELEIRDAAMAEAEAKLQQQALSDALTGLPNRRLLNDRLSQSIASAKRDGSMVGVLYIDLDGFKLVNDSFGHNFGDQLLIRVTERIASRIRKSDTLSRFGGDEFVIVISGLKAVEHAEQLAQLLLQVIAKPYTIEGQEIQIGASIGISVFPQHAGSGSELLQFADSAMYSAKRSGKNCVVVFTENLGESVRERSAIENQLRHAIDAGEITVYYQPEFEVGSLTLVRFEALARWNHPTLGSIPPAKFIPVAEESGLIIPLGAFVFERACADCLSWQSSSAPPVEVAVNVSIVQFGRDTFVEEVEAALHKAGLDPRLLQIELTESVMLSGLEDAAATIRRLQAIGVTVAVDDFGTGYSALSYIAKLPFNALKIDRTFMKEIMQTSEARAMVQSIVLLAQQLGMKVIVEGVENEEQLGAIKEMGADQVQGFLLGRPTPDPATNLAHHLYETVSNAVRDGALLLPEKAEVL